MMQNENETKPPKLSGKPRRDVVLPALLGVAAFLVIVSMFTDAPEPKVIATPEAAARGSNGYDEDVRLQAQSIQSQPAVEAVQAQGPPTPTFNLGHIIRSVVVVDEIPGLKLSLDITLKRAVSEDELAAIARHLKANNTVSNFARTFMLYYLADQSDRSTAWASSHYNPELAVRIIGPTIAQMEAARNQITAENEIGRWLEPVFSGIMVLTKQDGLYVLKTDYPDGSGSEHKLQGMRVSGDLRLDYIEPNSFGEYMIVKENGVFQNYDEDGFIRTLSSVR